MRKNIACYHIHIVNSDFCENETGMIEKTLLKNQVTSHKKLSGLKNCTQTVSDVLLWILPKLIFFEMVLVLGSLGETTGTQAGETIINSQAEKPSAWTVDRSTLESIFQVSKNNLGWMDSWEEHCSWRDSGWRGNCQGWSDYSLVCTAAPSPPHPT